MNIPEVTNDPFFEILWDTLSGYSDLEAPVTYSLLGVVIGIFVLEVLFMVKYGLSSPRIFATGIFGIAPWAGWVLSPFLHKGGLHFLASVLGIWLVGIPIEQLWTHWQYAGFIILSGYLSAVVAWVSKAPFTTQEIAFYGSSGIVFALGGFALVNYPRWFGNVQKCEWLAAFFGGVAFLQVVFDLVTGPFFTVGWVNGGHLGGLMIGVFAGFWKRPP